MYYTYTCTTLKYKCMYYIICRCACVCMCICKFPYLYLYVCVYVLCIYTRYIIYVYIHVYVPVYLYNINNLSSFLQCKVNQTLTPILQVTSLLLRNKDLKIIFLSKRIQVLCGDKTTKTVSRSITAECLLLMWNYL